MNNQIEQIINSNNFDEILNLIKKNPIQQDDFCISFDEGSKGNLLHHFILSKSFAKKESIEIIKLLLQKGYSVNKSTQRKKLSAEIFTPLQLAILTEKYYLIDILLDNNADPNQADENKDKWPPLFYIIDSSLDDQKTCIQINKLLKAGATVPTNYTSCPKIMTKPESLKCIKEWLEQKSLNNPEAIEKQKKSNQFNENGWLPIFHKIKEGDLDGVVQLIKDFADIYKKDKDGWTSFHYAVHYNQPHILEELFKKSDLKQHIYYDKNGWGPLHLACDNNKQIIDLLVKKNCNELLHKENNGNNPLNIAAAKGNFYPFELSVKYNLNIFDQGCLNRNNENFIDIAIKSGFFREVSDSLILMEKKI